MSNSVMDINEFSISNYKKDDPLLGERSFPLSQIVLTAGTPLSFDLKTLSNLHRVEEIKSIFLDWSAGSGTLSMTTLAGGTIKIQQGTQSYMPVALSADNVITFLGNGTLNFTLFNVDFHVGPWNTGASGGGTTVIGSLGNNADGVTPVTTGNIGADAYGYGYDKVGATWDRVSINPGLASSALAYTQTGNTLIIDAVIRGNTGASLSTITAINPNSDGITGVEALAVAGLNYLDNGTSYDRQRGNVDTGAIVTFAAQAAGTVNSADQVNYNGRGVKVFYNISALGAATTVTFNLQIKDSVSGNYFTVLSSTAIAATGSGVLTLYPGLTSAANITANDILPRDWRVQAVVAGTNTATGTVGASVIV